MQNCLGPLTEKQAQAVCRSTVLYHGAVGAVEQRRLAPDGTKQPDKVRTVHDGAVIGITHRIHRNWQGRTTSPSIHEARKVMQLQGVG